MKKEMVRKAFLIAVFLILIVLTLYLAYAVNLIALDYGLNTENLTFTGNQNITRNITLYRNASVFSAYINISGYNYTLKDNATNYNPDTGIGAFDYLGTKNNTRVGIKRFICGNISTVGVWANYYNSSGLRPSGNWNITVRKVSDDSIFLTYDMGDISTMRYSPSLTNYYEANFTSNFICEEVWITKEFLNNDNYTLRNSYPHDVSNTGVETSFVLNDMSTLNDSSPYYKYHTFIFSRDLNKWTDNCTEVDYYGCNPENTLILSNGVSMAYRLVYQPMAFYPANVSLKIGNTNIWNSTGEFKTVNNRTADLSSYIKTLLANNCALGSLTGSNCTLNLTFHSDTNGTVRYSDLIINWTEYNKPNLTLSEPNQTYTGITFVPLKFSVSDDYALQYCKYNVTRGASTEIQDTEVSNCQNMTFTVSGDATYLISLCANDTAGNTNCTSAYFKTVSYIPPENTGLGGGGGYNPPQEITNKTIAPNLEDNLMGKLSETVIVIYNINITWFTLGLVITVFLVLIYEIKNGGLRLTKK